MSEETEVFRINEFDTNKCYAFALKTRSTGSWPNEKHYTTNKLQYLGKHIKSERWGERDSHGGAETFIHDGVETRVVYDYHGETCFTPFHKL